MSVIPVRQFGGGLGFSEESLNPAHGFLYDDALHEAISTIDRHSNGYRSWFGGTPSNPRRTDEVPPRGPDEEKHRLVAWALHHKKVAENLLVSLDQQEEAEPNLPAGAFHVLVDEGGGWRHRAARPTLLAANRLAARLRRQSRGQGQHLVVSQAEAIHRLTEARQTAATQRREHAQAIASAANHILRRLGAAPPPGTDRGG